MCSIQALLSAPNPDDPLADNVAQHWKTNEAEAMETGESSRHRRALAHPAYASRWATDTLLNVLLCLVLLPSAAKQWTRQFAMQS